MASIVNIQTDPFTAADSHKLKALLIKECGFENFEYRIERRSIDARSRFIKVNLTIACFQPDELPKTPADLPTRMVPGKLNGKKVHIIGSGPAGLFAALSCLHLGLTPIIIERGKNVRERRRDLAAVTRNHLVHPDSNYCFGEGGAGTYSDGKLYTRSGDRNSVEEVLRTFVFFGASPDILVDAHPHIGTNKLPGIIENMRQFIIANGGTFLFHTRLENLIIQNRKVMEVVLKNTYDGTWQSEKVNQLILATGHSANDIYFMLQRLGIYQEFKPYALGFRIEHPQEQVDAMQYRCTADQLHKLREVLPAASYAMSAQVDGRGVYSFCMCPGGIIAPCATQQHEIVTNGWSPSKRDNPFANAGWVTEIGAYETRDNGKDPLAGLHYRSAIEHRAQQLAGGGQTAPAQRLVDFLQKKLTKDVLPVSYLPGIRAVAMDDVLPAMIANRMRKGLQDIVLRRKGFFSHDAMIVAPETRTSTPVRIPRDKVKLNHPDVSNLFPCGEGAGYAGGIASAAMDGMRVAEACVYN